jgi:acetyl-CoA acetyltransferase family protein
MTAPAYQRFGSSGNGKAVFISGTRSPFVKSFGAFEDTDTLELFSRTVDGLLRGISMDPKELDEIIAGVVIPQTKNPNVARDAVVALGLPAHIHGYTLNRACTSSLQGVADAAKSIGFGHAISAIVGGVECLSDVPIVYSKSARKFLVKVSKAKTTADKLGLLRDFSAKAWLPSPPSLTEPLTGYTMGDHAEMMAKIWEISREEQDAFAVRSHHRAAAAIAEGKFKDEITPIWSAPKYATCVDADNIVRADTTLEQMQKLRPVFDRKWGTITAANASPLTDGASAALICDGGRAKDLGLKPRSLIRDFVFVGVQPHPQLLIGPAIAIPMLLKKHGLTTDDIDLFEIHEAFAAQVLCCLKALKSSDFQEKYFGEAKAFGEIPDEKLNVNGGAIAIGHPFGATGTRLITTITNELHRRQGKLGVVAVCAAGGMAGAMLIERM